MISKFIQRDQRLSLINLSDAEIYFEEYSCTFYFGQSFLPIPGSLHYCSQSLIFVPENARYGILKFFFENILKGSMMEYTPAKESSKFGKESLFSLSTNLYIEMKKDNKDHPYIFNKNDGKEKFIFGLKNTYFKDFLKKIDNSFSVWKSGQGKYDILKQLKSDFDFKQKNTSFDVSWVDDLKEQKVKEITGFMVTPLMDIPGRIYLTNEKLYFQPFYSLGSSPVKKFALKSITKVVKRRYILRQIGFELFTRNESHFFCVGTPKERDELYSLIIKQDSFNSSYISDLNSTTLKWQNGEISNFDYLMYLNFVSDRTFNDLTQYPVFPWVIADYTSDELDLSKLTTYRNLSQPIGALNSKRLKYFKDRYKEMWGDEKFLYGTHYSCPGYVLYFLVRQAPEYMLHLQNGKFDDPDRSFYSIEETWDSVLNNNTDLKELIPEFFQSNGDFLLNSKNLALGTKNNGKRVHHVILPKWAKDERDFILKNRQVLESEYVSGNLHHWIDLIFGSKQKGEESVKANNVFHPMTYEGTVDLENLSEKDRIAVEVQIKEFGQTPKQIFTSPHPKKLNKRPFPAENVLNNEISWNHIFSQTKSEEKKEPELNLFDFKDKPTIVEVPKFFTEKVSNDKNFMSNLKNLQVDQTINLHKKSISSIYLEGDTIYSSSLDGTCKIYSIDKKRQLRRITDMEDTNLLSCVFYKNKDVNNLIAGGENDNILDYGKIFETLEGHNDSVNRVSLYKDTLLSGSSDNTIKIWKCYTNGSFSSVPEIELEDHDSPIISANFDSTGQIIVSGSKNGFINVHDLRSKQLVKRFSSHSSVVTEVTFLGNDSQRIVSTSLDKTLTLHDTFGNPLIVVDTNEPLLCLWTEGNSILIGGSEGNLKLYDTSGRLMKSLTKQKSSITGISVGDNGNSILTSLKDGDVVYWKSK